MQNISNTPLARRRVTLCGALAATILLTACATSGTTTPEQLVQQRSTARWNALLAGDLKKAYGYLAPSYRAITPYEKYINNIGGAATWVSADVIRVECGTDKCSASVKIEAKPIVAMRYKGTITTGVNETWLLEDGQWWLFQKL